MGAVNKRWSRKLQRRCPVCGSKVRIASHGQYWWVYCPEGNPIGLGKHIPQKLFFTPEDVIKAWENGE